MAVSARLGILANEVVLQKRMAIVQSVLLFLCLAFVIFSRSLMGEHLELPMMRDVMSKSRRRRRSAGESGSTSPALTRPNSSREGGGGEEWFEMDGEHRQRSRDDGRTMSPVRPIVERSLTRSISSNELSDSESRSEPSASPRSTPRGGHASRNEVRPSPLTPIKRPRHINNTPQHVCSEDAVDVPSPFLVPATP